jgi:hypothetical protein
MGRRWPDTYICRVIGSRTRGIKMGSPVKVRRYPRSCKEASSTLVEQMTTVAL